MDAHHIGSVSLNANKTQSLGAIDNTTYAGDILEGGMLAILVVFADVNCRQFPDNGHVDGLEHDALICGSEIGRAHV